MEDKEVSSQHGPRAIQHAIAFKKDILQTTEGGSYENSPWLVTLTAWHTLS